MIHLPFRKPQLPQSGVLRTWTDAEDPYWYERTPLHIRKNLEKAHLESGAFEHRASGLGWEEVIYTPNADGTAITAAANAIIIPDFSIPASYMTVGKILKYTLMGRYSSAITTPGTVIHILKWGGVGGVAQVTSGAFAPDPTAAASNLTWMAEYWLQCRSVGVAGTAMGFGRIEWSDYDDASAATIVGNLNMRMAPVSAPATAVMDTTIDKLLSATATLSVATGSLQTHVGILEAVN